MQALPAPVLALFAASGLPTSSFGLLVQPADRPARPFVSWNADLAFQMASTIKLVTALAALDMLGPDYRWRTHAYLDGALLDGRLLGDLVIVGGGDVSLSSDGLRAWFAQLRARGLREVWGDIVLDRYAFSLQEDDHASTPPPEPTHPGYARPDALTLDEGVLRVALQPAAKRPATVQLSPGQSGLRVVNRVRLGSRCSATARLEPSVDDSRLVVRGEWAATCGDKQIAQFALPHAEFTERAVAELWREEGGRLRGRVRNRHDDELEPAVPRALDGNPLEPWDSLASPTLSVLVRDMNKSSDNLVARTLFLSLATGFPQQPATLPEARARLAHWLHAQGMSDDDIVVDNGSGLSRSERGTPRALVKLLLGAWRGPNAQAFVDSLPVAGVDGTLGRRMTDGAATGRAHLKTGTTAEARALAGYVRCRSGRSQAVAAFVNHPDAGSATPTLDAVIEWVATNG